MLIGGALDFPVRSVCPTVRSKTRASARCCDEARKRQFRLEGALHVDAEATDERTVGVGSHPTLGSTLAYSETEEDKTAVLRQEAGDDNRELG